MRTLTCVSVLLLSFIIGTEANLGNETSRRLVESVINDIPQGPGLSCIPGLSCDWGLMPSVRGICVSVNNGMGCWDVCNPAHTAESYVVGIEANANKRIAMLVNAVRNGANAAVRCPAAAIAIEADPCPPGDKCTAANIPVGRGMCGFNPDIPGSHACLDVCVDRHRFVTGEREEVADLVQSMRNSSVCTGRPPVWTWVVILLLILLLLGAGFAVVVFLMRSKGWRALKASDNPRYRDDFE